MYITIRRVRTFDTLEIGDELVIGDTVTTVLDIVKSTPDRPIWRVYSEDKSTGAISLRSGTEDQIVWIIPPKDEPG